jgi:hypothetical protein
MQDAAMTTTTPAEIVLTKIGGATVAAQVCQVDPSTPHRWTYPREKGGTGGHIPVKHRRALLQYARENGIELTAADFFGADEMAA